MDEVTQLGIEAAEQGEDYDPALDGDWENYDPAPIDLLDDPWRWRGEPGSPADRGEPIYNRESYFR